MMGSSLAKKMRMLRAREGWGLVQASQILGIERRTLRDLELGKREPRYATLRNIASVYGIGLDELVGEGAVGLEPNYSEKLKRPETK